MSSKNSYQKIGQVDIESTIASKEENPSGNKTLSNLSWVVGILILIAVVFYIYGQDSAAVVPDSLNSLNSFDVLGRYVMTNFDRRKPMASFLPGLGGLWGIPMWTFYINRGQGICAFGIQNKDGGISKYNTAEKAYQQTPFTGFRTFLKGSVNGKSWNTMPFFPFFEGDAPRPSRDMMIGYNELEIQEIDKTNEIQTNILYYNIPGENFPGLVRKTKFTNLNTKSTLELEVLDGLGKLEPNGLSNFMIDAMGRTMEAWMNVYNVESDSSKPFFHISQGTADTATVQIINDGYFAIAYIENDSATNDTKAPDLLSFVVDPTVIFDTDTVMGRPHNFFDKAETTTADLLNQMQCTTSRTPCAYAGTHLSIPPSKSITITSIYGYAPTLEIFLSEYVPKLTSGQFSTTARTKSSSLIDDITSVVDTNTSSYIFNAYVKQNFLDNTLRGGMPLQLTGGGSGNNEPEKMIENKLVHVYSRIHGDIERDYNNYQIDTTYFSQGPGNFRDVSQNRRNEVLHAPELFDFNIRMFLSFVQSDGYNPLTVAGTLFRIPSAIVSTVVRKLEVEVSNVTALTSILNAPFRIGLFFHQMSVKQVVSPLSRDEILHVIMKYAQQYTAGQYAPGQGGFWADHWTYTLDHIDTFLEVYPDKEEFMLWHSKPVPFFLSPAVVRSRDQKYVLVLDENVPQFSTTFIPSSVFQWGDLQFPLARQQALLTIYSDPTYTADVGGAGAIWQRNAANVPFTVTSIAKLGMLGIIKFATMDPFGMGVEMEGGKPGWNDAMNGLPGLQGSGMSETYEMLRIIEYLHAAVVKYPDNGIDFPVEFSELIVNVNNALKAYFASPQAKQEDFDYWDATNTAREKYRQLLVATFDGRVVTWNSSDLHDFFVLVENKVNIGIQKAVTQRGGLSPTYFYYECDKWEVLNQSSANPVIVPLSFVQHQLPLFLEGSVRYLKILNSTESKREVYSLTKQSSVYDSKLKMFLISESMKGIRQDIGRMMAFSPGWLENESVWLHMSYKFYLELLRGGLYEEFYTELSTGLVPFMNFEVYGRSPLEAGSFVVSSAFPDERLHGQSFLARLSGSTAEFISMWSLMMVGPTPFVVDTQSGKLLVNLKPALPSWMFYSDGTLSFKFLGSISVTYHNLFKQDTWKIEPTSAVVVALNGTRYESDTGVIKGDLAHLIRNRKVSAIDIYFDNH